MYHLSSLLFGKQFNADTFCGLKGGEVNFKNMKFMKIVTKLSFQENTPPLFTGFSHKYFAGAAINKNYGDYNYVGT